MVTSVTFIFDKRLPLNPTFLFRISNYQTDMFNTREILTAENANFIWFAYFTEELHSVALRFLNCERVFLTPLHVEVLYAYPGLFGVCEKVEPVKFLMLLIAV